MLRVWTTEIRQKRLKTGFYESKATIRKRAIEEYNKQYNWPIVSVIEEWFYDYTALELTIYYQDNSEYPKGKEENE